MANSHHLSLDLGLVRWQFAIHRLTGPRNCRRALHPHHSPHIGRRRIIPQARDSGTFRPDASTPSGRDECRSLAYEIARSKTTLVKIGKGLTEGWRKSTQSVNAECKTIEERMDELRDKVRAPLTAWENAEKDRVAGHEAALAAITEAPDYGQNETAHELRQRYDVLCSYPVRDWQEFAPRADAVLTAEILRTERLLAAAVKREAEAAELDRLRALEAERERLAAIEAQRQREAQIAAEAAERAKREAEEAAAAQAKAAAEAVERERRLAEQKAEAERQAAAQREQEALEAQEHAEARARQAETGRLAAIEKAERDLAEAARKADADRVAAIEAERRRVAAAVAAAKAEADRRAADKEHRATINREAASGIMDAIGEFTTLSAAEAEKTAKAIVVAIAKQQIKHITIGY